MNPVLERKLALSKAMRVFEKESNLLNILYTYSECIKELASDRPDDFQRVLERLQNG